jgi:ABC-type multidrug transport system ATPase subunit
VLSARGLGKKFGSRWVFRNLEFDLEMGQCLVVQGRNGAGKSTLLRILASLERASEGEVKAKFIDYRTALSYCALDQAVFPNLTVREHLDMAAKLRGIDRSNNDLIAKVGLETHVDHQSQHLSSGLRSRLKIAIAIQSSPEILLWDEPGVALDDSGRELITQVIEEQKQRGVLVIATNDASERRFGTHALELI